MVSAPSPTVPGERVSPSVDFGAIWQSFTHGLWAGFTASPLTVAAAIVVALLVAVRLVHSLAHPPGTRDPVRRFTREDKAELLRRAGGRCERHGWITGRCKATAGLQADHVHPHSRGGWTNISNGQALCKRHNRSKSAAIPFNWQLKRIAKHRAAYYPPGLPGTVVRRARPRRPTRES
jgi:5-methylcytosine-specific restriction endonuclease McrA